MCLRSRRRLFGMAYANILALLLIFFSILLQAQSLNNTSKHKHDSLDTLLNGIIGEIPRKDSSKFFEQLFKIEKETKNQFTISPTKDEPGTKKSTEATPPPDPHDNAAVSVALSKPSVYFVDLGLKTQAESSRTQEYNTAKRFRIPQSKPRLQRDRILPMHQKDDDKPDTPLKYDSIIYIHPKDGTVTSITDPKATVLEDVTESHERRAKRQEGSSLSEGLPILSSTTDAGIQTLPVQTLNSIIPSQSNIGDIGVRSDVNAVASNRVVAMVPVKMETPLESSPSVAMVSQTLVQPDALGTSRSTLPVTTLIQTSPHESVNTLRSPHVGNLFLKLSDQHNRFATSGNQDSKLKVTPGEKNENEVIKLAQVPLSFFDEKTKQFKHKKMSAYEHTNPIKLDQLSIKPLKTKDSEKLKTNSKEKTQEDINKETLETLQSRLTNIISKLEEKVNKHQRRVKQPKKEKSLKTLVKNNPSEKSLTLLKNRLSNVLKKFNSKPGAGQPFTIGKEWRNVLKNGPSQGGEATNTKMKKMKNAKEDDGNWPSIASQLLRKLDRALIKLQEQRVARSLGKNAVMYFSFDKPTTTVANTNAIEDKSDHFNDALTSGKAHTSSRAYGSCGKALILNSGNLRFTTKYFEKKPTKAITLTMWVRTNVTGYVKWFVRDSGRSRDFNTHTQYPLVNKNVWTHLCGTYNSSTGITRIYVDGELKTEKVNKQQESIPADFTPAGIGPEFGDENLIAVDEVYMFARALDPKEVRTLYDNCEFNRMVLHYGFQKINRSAGLVFDQSGLHNDGYLQGDAQILDSGCDKCGSCLNLNAKSNPRLTIQATHFKHRPTKAISIGAWFNLNSTTGTHSLFSVTESIFKSTILDLLVTDGKLQWKGYNKDHNTIFNMATTQAVVPEGIWVHILATFDSLHGQAKIFIDGHQKALAKTTKKVPIAEDWSEIKIGGHKSRAQAWGGYIDEFVLYNWELEPSEISYIMKYCPDHPKLVSFTVHVPLD